jgi:hypothetical protein
VPRVARLACRVFPVRLRRLGFRVTRHRPLPRRRQEHRHPHPPHPAPRHRRSSRGFPVRQRRSPVRLVVRVLLIPRRTGLGLAPVRRQDHARVRAHVQMEALGRRRVLGQRLVHVGRVLVVQHPHLAQVNGVRRVHVPVTTRSPRPRAWASPPSVKALAVPAPETTRSPPPKECRVRAKTVTKVLTRPQESGPVGRVRVGLVLTRA